MKLNELLTESQQLELDQLQEGPILNKIGTAVGKGVGALAKGVGAVAGGVAGLGSAVKKGFQAGKKTVAGAGDEPETGTAGQQNPQPAAGSSTGSGVAQGLQKAFGGKPAADQPAAKAAAPAAADQTAAEPAASAAPQAKPAAKPAAAAAQPAAKAQPAANDTAYAQAQKAVNGLSPEQKKEIVAMLQADPKVKAAMTKPQTKAAPRNPDVPMNPATGKPLTEPERAAHQAAGGKFDGVTGDPLPLDTKASAPTAKTKAAPQAAPKDTGQAAAAAASAGQDPEAAAKQAMAAKNPKLGAAMQQAGEMPATAKKPGSRKKPAAPSQAEIDADRERIMGVTSDSVIRTSDSLAEALEKKVQEYLK